MVLTAHLKQYRRLRRLLCALLIAGAAIPAVTWLISQAEANPTATATDAPELASVTAPGRIEPRDGVLTIAATPTATAPAIVSELHAQAGDWAERGTVLAILSGRPELEAALVASERRIMIAQARLDALQAPAKEDDLRALRAEVASADAHFHQAQSEARRFRELHETQLVSVAALEAQESQLTVASRTLEAARARLAGLSRARPADLVVATAELQAARAETDEARARLETTLVRAPCAGRVLAIHAQPGQAVGASGLLSFGRTSEMFVDAEVMEEDLGRLGVGQKARITGAVLAGVAEGEVEQIGYVVGSREVFETDPTAFTDSRVAHVKIRVAESVRFERFIHARVAVEILR
jgi:HlyD family secretion protein